MRVGAEWRVELTKTFITTREFLQEWGGTGGFGLQFAGSDARLLRLVYVGRGKYISGIEYLRLVNYADDFPFEEQP